MGNHDRHLQVVRSQKSGWGILLTTLIMYQYRVGVSFQEINVPLSLRARILVQVTIYRRLLIGRDGHPDSCLNYRSDNFPSNKLGNGRF